MACYTEMFRFSFEGGNTFKLKTFFICIMCFAQQGGIDVKSSNLNDKEFHQRDDYVQSQMEMLQMKNTI